MKLWTWKRLKLQLQEHLKERPEDAAVWDQSIGETFAEFLAIDGQRCELAARIIGCHCAESLKDHQKLIVALKRIFYSTPAECLGKAHFIESLPRELLATFKRITERYRNAKKCHRNWQARSRSGIYCYCDEHAH